MWVTVPGSLTSTMGPSVHPLSGQSASWGANEVLGKCGGILRVGEVNGTGHGLQANGVLIHIHGREGDRVGSLVRRPRGDRLDCVKDM